MSCDRSQVCDTVTADFWDLFVKDWLMEFLILLQNHIHILKRKHLAIFQDFRCKFRGMAKFWRSKKNTEIQQLAHANLFVIILNSLFYSKEDMLQHGTDSYIMHT